MTASSTRELDRERYFAALDHHFERTLGEHGPSARGVDWSSAEAQERRFRELLRVCEDSGERGGTLLDYGCGYGGLLGYMRAREYGLDYTGFDVSERMLAHARELWADAADARFIGSEQELEAADYVVASGLFGLKLDSADEAWLDYALDTLGALDRLARRGFAFNMLTSYSDPERMRADLYYADPGSIFDFCKRRFSRNVALLHDYDLYEFTVIVRK